MKISNKISLSFFVGSIFLGVVATSVIYKIGNESLNALVSNQLRTIVISRSVHIETILEGYKKINEMLATGNIFKNAVDISKDYNERIDQANKRIKNTLQSFPAISRIRLLDENGIVIASSHKDIGFDESTERIFLKGREGVFIEDIHVSKITGNIVVRVASPVTLNGEFAGVAIINFNEKELFGIAMDKTGLGKTGEIYFVDKNGYIISPSRFKDKSFLKIRVNYEDIKKIGIEKQEHIFSIYSNYRGIEVLGVREHISLLKGSIVAEIDKNEALELLLKMQNLLIFIVIFIFFGSWLIGLFVGRIISQPILMLKKGSEII
ncbi:MAG: cache domain-containing protein, partial [Candidatus Omnitrophica bacterium]|nr:cache domain-containing protein [Candidatus Omnitrophota bacterium]